MRWHWDDKLAYIDSPIGRLSQKEIFEICDLATTKWHAAGKRQRVIPFCWRDHKLVSRRTCFRLIVDTIDGQPVCCRYF